VKNYLNRILGVLLLIGPLALVSCGNNNGTEVSKAKPVAPKNLTAQLIDKGVQLSWEPVAGARHYTVFWGTERGDYRALANTDAVSVVLPGLKAGSLYTFAVTCWNPMGESSYSREVMLVYDDNPTRAGAHLAKANQLMSKGVYSEAQAYFSAAIGLDPSNPEAYRDRAQLYAKLQKHDMAQADNSMAEQLFKNRPISALQYPPGAKN
jgi:tetratricopeptide (TPR) repeat protein